jgi:hypothetical protein
LFTGPRTQLVRAVCHTSQGLPYSLFRAKADLLGLEVVGWDVDHYATVNTWLFMHYGCEVKLDDAGTVKLAKMWSVG